MLLSGGGDRPASPAPLPGACPGRPRRSAGPPPGILRAWGRRTAQERRARLSPARLPLPPAGATRTGECFFAALLPSPAPRCLRSVVTCHCRSRSFIKLCLLSAPAPPVLPFAGGRALGVNWFCAEGSRGGRERRVPLCRAQLSLVGKRGLLRAPRLCCRPGLRPGPLFPTRVRGGEAPAERSCFFAL